MTAGEAQIDMDRALQLSLELLAAAESGDVQATVRLDAERRRLLESTRRSSTGIDGYGRSLLRRISELNARAIGFMEHHLRIKARELDMAAAGRRAVAAYSTVSRR